MISLKYTLGLTGIIIVILTHEPAAGKKVSAPGIDLEGGDERLPVAARVVE